MLTILLLPRTKIVTARVFAHSSMTSIFSFVVPNVISLTRPARPSLSAVRSSKRGTIRPLVAIAISYNAISLTSVKCRHDSPRSLVLRPIGRQAGRFA